MAKSKPKAKAKAKKPAAKKTAVKKAKPAAKKVSKPAAKKVVKKAAPKAAKKKAPVKKVLKTKTSKAKPASSKKVKASKPAAKTLSKTPLLKKSKIRKMVEHDELGLRYSDEELKEFKELIDGKLASAREELKNLKDALDNHTESQAGNKAWNMEEGTDTSEMEYLMNQISRQHAYIRNLELALVRIENKTYGICRLSGKLIPKERLRVVPHATLSLEAKMNRKTDEETALPQNAEAPPADFSEAFED